MASEVPINQATKHFYKFDRFIVDVTERLLLCDGEMVPLTQKAFDVLLVLVKHHGQLVGKEELIQSVWPDSFVEEGNLTQNIYILRRALGQGVDGQDYIKTVPRRGYRFVADVSESRIENDQADAPTQTTPPLKESSPLSPDEQTDRLTVAPDPPINSKDDTAVTGSVASGSTRHRTVSLFGQHKAIVIIAILIILVAGNALWLYFYFGGGLFGDDRLELSPKVTLTNLTNTGNITCAAISPDSKYAVYATLDKFNQSSLWLQQVDTVNRRTIIPATETRYPEVTFSPDSNYIYYVAATKQNPVRTLYRISTLGGPVTKVLDRVETRISFSPDGSQFVFRRVFDDRREAVLIVANTDGNQEREIATISYPEHFNDPAWSPDGKLIACGAGLTQGTANMYVVGVSTEDWSVRQISRERWEWIGKMAWLADASGLLMAAQKQPGETYQVWRLDYPQGTARKITTDTITWNSMSMAKDASAIVGLHVQLVTNIWMLPSGDASRAKQITFGAGGYRSAVSWTPDGKIVVDTGSPPFNTISIIDADGNNPRQLTGGALSREWLGASTTGNGRYIVFASDSNGERHIWRMDRDGSNPVQLTFEGGEDQPHCSPDGQWVIYTRMKTPGAPGPTMWKVSIDGGEPVQLTDYIISYPVISPDGKLIACLTQQPGFDGWKIAVLPFDGGSPVTIFPQTVQELRLRWTPDGRGVSYIENPAAASSRIWVQPLNGGEPKLVAEFETDRVFGFDWSRDGRHLAVVRGLWAANAVLLKDFQ